MPKIEVNQELFYSLVGRKWDHKESLEAALACAKAELDAIDPESVPPSERVLKIELNDTNRPDLWGTAGCARQLRVYHGGKQNEYPFFSRKDPAKDAPPPDERETPPTLARSTAAHTVKVQESVRNVRPFLAGFIASGKAVTDASLRDMIQTQEKLAWNFGRKRRTVSMGLYRIAIIQWPIIYKGVDPDSVSFTPLQWDVPLTLREILKQHPKGKEYSFIQEHEPIHPLLVDSKGDVLSYPPIINSADLGAVQVGDTDLFIELTGSDIECVTLSASIMACDLADQGYTIEPVNVEYEYDTPYGKKITTPFYFQKPVFCSLARVEKFLGEKLDADQCVAALAKMGVKAEKTVAAECGETAVGQGVYAFPPEYRNDFLHAADIVEDVMIGRGLSTFTPARPSEFTIGRLSPITILSRKVKEILIGMGYQEMVFNYLGSKRDFIDRMLGDGAKIIKIANPMTENYEYVRDSILSSLLISESSSGAAVFPHRIFETGKVAYQNPSEDYGASTRQFLGFLTADKDANFNMVSTQIQTLFYYLSREYTVEPSKDPRFIAGRAANILFKGAKIGVFGEIHPQVLENWGVTMPCAAAELDLDALINE